MYRVLIVDDEKIVRLAIKAMIRWDSGDFEFAGSAGNGEEALKLCRRRHPDIVITDLKMPGMDGIELIKRLKADNFDGEILVLSNFNDFNLVRDAMKYGAYDYILKVTMSSSGFMKAMEEIADKLGKKDRSVYRKESKQSDLPEKRRSFLRKMIESGNCTGQKDEQNLYALGKGSCLQIFAVSHQDSGQGMGGNPSSDVLNDIASDISADIDYHIMIKLNDSSSLLLLHYVEPAKSDAFPEPQFVASQIKSLTKLYYNRTVGIIFCRNVFDFSSLMSELQNCISAGLLLFYRDSRDSALSTQTKPTNDDAPIKKLMPQIIEDVSAGILENDMETLTYAMKRLIGSAGKCNLNPAVLKKDIKKILNSVENGLVQKNLQDGNLFELYPNGTDVIAEAHTDTALLKNLYQISESAMNRIRLYRPYRKEVAMSMEFIEKHISSKITVSQIAEHVNMTETYISKIFHQETGKSIIDYINYHKMKKAYKLLVSGDCLIKEAADSVGISDQFYFSRLFKKYYGLNPSGIKKPR